MTEFDLFEDLLIGNENTNDPNLFETSATVENADGVLKNGQSNVNVHLIIYYLHEIRK